MPYSRQDQARESLAALRHVYSSAVRAAYANALHGRGKPLKQKDLRQLVMEHFDGGKAGAWLLHCATLEGMDLRKLRPDGQVVFGTRANLLRRKNAFRLP